MGNIYRFVVLGFFLVLSRFLLEALRVRGPLQKAGMQLGINSSAVAGRYK